MSNFSSKCVRLALYFLHLLTLSDYLDEKAAGQDGAKEIGPPKFITQVASKVEISEGQSAHFEARLTPTEDPNMKVFFQSWQGVD